MKKRAIIALILLILVLFLEIILTQEEIFSYFNIGNGADDAEFLDTDFDFLSSDWSDPDILEDNLATTARKQQEDKSNSRKIKQILGASIDLEDELWFSEIDNSDDLSYSGFQTAPAQALVQKDKFSEVKMVFGRPVSGQGFNVDLSRGLKGRYTWRLINPNSSPGLLSIKMPYIKNFENGCNEPEALVDDTCSDPGEGEGELYDRVYLTAFFQNKSKQQTQFPSFILSESSPKVFQQYWLKFFDRINQRILFIPPNQYLDFMIEWSIAPEMISNIIQSDSIEFKFVFELEPHN